MIKLTKNLTQSKLNLVCTRNLDKNIVSHLTTDILRCSDNCITQMTALKLEISVYFVFSIYFLFYFVHID